MQLYLLQTHGKEENSVSNTFPGHSLELIFPLKNIRQSRLCTVLQRIWVWVEAPMAHNTCGFTGSDFSVYSFQYDRFPSMVFESQTYSLEVCIFIFIVWKLIFNTNYFNYICVSVCKYMHREQCSLLNLPTPCVYVCVGGYGKARWFIWLSHHRSYSPYFLLQGLSAVWCACVQ